MTGTASWEQIIFIIGGAFAIVGAMFGIFKYILERQSKMHIDNLAAFQATTEQHHKLRADLQAGYEHQFIRLDTRIQDESRRIDQIEIFNAGLRFLVQSIDEFKEDVRSKFEGVTRDRKEDVSKIDRKLDQIISDQLRRRKEINGEI